jgi:hypothetical protein
MSQCDDTLAAVLRHVGEGWSCQLVDHGWLHVTTSHQYSDGDLVELLIKRSDDRIVISDGGETAARLDLAGVNVEKGRARELWTRLLRAHQLEFANGRLRQEGSIEETGWLAENMANALPNIDAIRLIALPPPTPAFSEQLVTFLEAEFVSVEEQPQLAGRSGIVYRPTASARGNDEPVFIQAVAGGRAQARQRAVEHAFTMFSDVNGSLPTEQKLVVLAGGTTWKYQHVELLSEVAYVASWDSRDNLVTHIRTPGRDIGLQVLGTNKRLLLAPAQKLSFDGPPVLNVDRDLPHELPGDLPE